MREAGKDWTGNSVYLWAIANAVYMSLLGPKGIQEVGELILQQAHYAAQALPWHGIKGVRNPIPQRAFFKEFVVNFDATGKTVARIEARRLRRRHGIFGGKDISAEFPELGQSALYCVTEVHGREDIDRLAAALEKEVSGDEREGQARDISCAGLERTGGHGDGRPISAGAASSSPPPRKRCKIPQRRRRGQGRTDPVPPLQCAGDTKDSARDCPSSPSPRCCTTICISRRRRWA